MTALAAPLAIAFRHAASGAGFVRQRLLGLEPRVAGTLVLGVSLLLTGLILQLGRVEARHGVVDELDLTAQLVIEDVHTDLDRINGLLSALANASADEAADVEQRRDGLSGVPGVMEVHITEAGDSHPAGSGPLVTANGDTLTSASSVLSLTGSQILILHENVTTGAVASAAVDLERMIESELAMRDEIDVEWLLHANNTQARSERSLTHSEFLTVGPHTYRLDLTPAAGSSLAAEAESSKLLTGVGLAVSGWAAWAAASLVRRRQAVESEEVARRREAENRVAWSEEILDQSGVAVIFTDLAGRVSYWNQQAERQYGWTAEEAVGRPIVELTVPAASVDNAIDTLGAVRTDGYWEGEFDVCRKDGTVFPARVSNRLLLDADGLPRGIVGVSTDVTDEQRVRDGLKDLIRSKDEFLAAVSHELRTPLTAIVGFAEVLQDADSMDAGEVSDLHDLVAQQARDMSDLVEDLLVAGRIDTETVTIRPRPTMLAELVAQVTRPWSRNGGADTIEIDVDTDMSLLADPLRVRQIVRNLVTNGFRHGSPPVRVTAARTAEGSIQLTVTDSGDGVPADAVEGLFEPYSVVAQRHGQPASVGIGLYVSRRLAQLMDGDLAFEGTDGDSRFVLTLPAAPSS